MSSSDDDDCYDPSERQATLNISNDQYYEPKPGYQLRIQSLHDLDIPSYGSSTIKHSIPAYDLWLPFFPSYISEEKFRNFHRPKLRHYNTGPQARNNGQFREFPIKNLTRTIFRHQKRLRYRVIKAINNGKTREEIVDNYLLLRNAKDLTAKKGELFLFEYSEEYPPVLSQIGMSANIKTLIVNSSIVNKDSKSKSNTSTADNSNLLTLAVVDPQTSNQLVRSDNQIFSKTTYPIGHELTIHNTVQKFYYNELKPGTRLQVIENNMYRAPIYDHDVPSCDFLIIRTRNGFYIRTVKTIFTVGQTMPLIPIPQPIEYAIQKFRLDISNLYIHKFFKESKANPPVMDFKELIKLFPDYHPKTLRRRLAERGAKPRYSSSGKPFFEVGTSKYGSISKRDMRSQITPEQYCLNMAMLAARQRLRELNYSETMINPPISVEHEVEVLAAPWNTSRAVFQALAGKTYLDFKQHLIDPTGPQREGFSCVKWSKSPTEDEQAKERQFTKSDNSQPISLKNPFLNKIKREKLERLAIYQREAQMIAEVQSRSLSSKELLSSDEDDEDDPIDEDENILDRSLEEQLRDLDRLVLDGRTVNELNHEKEEEERRKMMLEFNRSDQINNEQATNRSKTNCDNDQFNVAAFNNKILKITRTYETEEGRLQRTELVRDPKIIALYVKQKNKEGPQDIRNVENPFPNNSFSGFSSNYADVSTSRKSDSHKRRRSSVSLGPSELCRADGTILTISKSVLDMRLMRNRRRQHRKDMMNL